VADGIRVLTSVDLFDLSILLGIELETEFELLLSAIRDTELSQVSGELVLESNLGGVVADVVSKDDSGSFAKELH